MPEYNFLEARQVKILDEVFKLKSYVDLMTVAVRVNDSSEIDFYPIPVETTSELSIKTSNQVYIFEKKKLNFFVLLLNVFLFLFQLPVTAEIIINVNPANPPYFILALQKIWTDVRFNVKIHTNSCNGDVERNVLFENQLTSAINSNAKHNINLVLIWKNGI